MQLVPEFLSSLSSALRPIDSKDESNASLLDHQEAAVLILLYSRPEGIHLLLTARPHTLSRHAGQISLPGGRAEPEDESLWNTAIRETEEELGIPRHVPIPLGRLDTHHLRVSGYRITPFVGWMPAAPVLFPDRREVDEVIEIPLEMLLNPASVVDGIWRLRDADWHIVYYQLGDHQVWGATARILHDLTTRIRTPLPEEAIPGSVVPVTTT